MNTLKKALALGATALLTWQCHGPAETNQEPPAYQPEAQSVAGLLADYPWETRWQAVGDSLQLAYVVVGEGDQTLLFIHGLGSYLRSWERTLPALADQYRCVALDLPGFGKSSKGDYPQSMAFYRDAVLAFMDAQDITQATLVGHSMGGQVALTVALDAPQRVSRLVLSAPAGIETFTPAEAQALRQAYSPVTYGAMTEEQVRGSYGLNFYQWPEAANPWVADRLAMRQGQDFPWFAAAFVRSIGGMLDGPVYARLPSLTQPTLVVYGEQDALIPNPYLHPQYTKDSLLQAVEQAIPHATTARIDSAGHFVHFEQAAAFNRHLTQFLNRH